MGPIFGKAWPRTVKALGRCVVEIPNLGADYQGAGASKGEILAESKVSRSSRRVSIEIVVGTTVRSPLVALYNAPYCLISGPERMTIPDVEVVTC